MENMMVENKEHIDDFKDTKKLGESVWRIATD